MDPKSKFSKWHPMNLLNNRHAMSVMYDAVIFLVLVSLSGMILFPVFQDRSQSESIIEEINERRVDDVAHMLLSSTPKKCNYSLASGFIYPFAESIGINLSNQEGLFHTVVNRIFGHELQHESFGKLIVENLGCQFHASMLNASSHQLNLITYNFTQMLSSEIDDFLGYHLDSRYCYHLHCYWYPINGVSFGGRLKIGQNPPSVNYFISEKKISMPFSPVFSWGNNTIVFAEFWIESTLRESLSKGYNELNNISILMENATNRNQSLYSTALVHDALTKNLSSLFIDIAIEGMRLHNQSVLFPGVLSLLIDDFFSSIIAIAQDYSEQNVQNAFEDAMSSLDSFLNELNGSSFIQPVSDLLSEQLLIMISDVFNKSFHCIEHAIESIKNDIKTLVVDQLEPSIQPFAAHCATMLLNQDQTFSESINELSSWIFDHFSFAQATVTLTIWEDHS